MRKQRAEILVERGRLHAGVDALGLKRRLQRVDYRITPIFKDKRRVNGFAVSAEPSHCHLVKGERGLRVTRMRTLAAEDITGADVQCNVVGWAWFKITKRKDAKARGVAYKDGVGKKLFLMTPIHHHFEKAPLSWPEPRIIVRFWIVSVMLALVALASLKLR